MQAFDGRGSIDALSRLDSYVEWWLASSEERNVTRVGGFLFKVAVVLFQFRTSPVARLVLFGEECSRAKIARR